jgi:hypothetical protein
VRDTNQGLSKPVPVSREMNFVTHLEMNKLFALSASVIRLLSTADRITTPKEAYPYVNRMGSLLGCKDRQTDST